MYFRLITGEDLCELMDLLFLIRQLKIMAMIKSDGYGHGLLQIAQELPADCFGVACLEEAMALRAAGIKTDILIVGCDMKKTIPQHK